MTFVSDPKERIEVHKIVLWRSRKIALKSLPKLMLSIKDFLSLLVLAQMIHAGINDDHVTQLLI